MMINRMNNTTIKAKDEPVPRLSYPIINTAFLTVLSVAYAFLLGWKWGKVLGNSYKLAKHTTY